MRPAAGNSWEQQAGMQARTLAAWPTTRREQNGGWLACHGQGTQLMLLQAPAFSCLRTNALAAASHRILSTHHVQVKIVCKQ